MNNNNHNNSCDFGETLVSYLYNEIGTAESAKFEAHASQCARCSGELGEFGAMRSSLAEWKQEDFASMGAPALEMPVAEMPVRHAPVILTDEPASWLDAIRNFFTPKVALTVAGFAAILVCMGLTLAFFSSQNLNNDNLVAGNSVPAVNSGPLVAPTKDTLSEKKVDVAQNELPLQKSAESDVSAKVISKASKPAHDLVNYQIKNNVAVNKNNRSDLPKEVRPKTAPLDTKSIYEETKDDSLRLADLFAEADTE
jgi:hypothetical protein